MSSSYPSLLYFAVFLIQTSYASLNHIPSWQWGAQRVGVSLLNSLHRGGGEPSAGTSFSSSPGVNSSGKKRLKRRKSTSKVETKAVSPLSTAPSSSEGNEPSHDEMPSLFNSPDEAQYDKYAACLAATEGLRRSRDAILAKTKHSAVNADSDKSWKSLLQPGGSKKRGNPNANEATEEEYKRACAQYVLNSSKVISALGLSVSQFNQMGREVGNNPALKDRVLEQAYLYRMAATIKMDKIPLIEDPNSAQLLKSHRRRRVQMFARSMSEIEDLRTEQMERLKKALKIDSLPAGINICDPNVLPILSPKVRAVCQAYPLQAEEIVKKYGLNSDEFNQMLTETRENPIFRWRVQKYMSKTESQNKRGVKEIGGDFTQEL